MSSVASPPLLDFRALFESLPGLYLVLATDLTIIAASDAYLQATMTRREEIIGRPAFEIFPNNPVDPDAASEKSARDSLLRVIRTGIADSLPLLKYDIRSANGEFEERYWSAVNSPRFDAAGHIAYVVHRVEDITDLVRLKAESSRQIHETETLRAR
ncbi:MAG: PAS domain-containing protein, partial [Pseudomonadota bacterium]|nr:PAS domain-containing protein [Pseudomonadota bacterium]